MEKQPQGNENFHLQDKPVMPLTQIQNVSTIPSTKQSTGLLWGGLGLLALCGLCCSAPVLAGASAILGTTAIIGGLGWPIIGLVIVLLVGIFILFKTIHKNTSTSGKVKNTSKRASCSANQCDTAGACGCKK